MPLKQKKLKVKGIIFDLDGTLIDSIEIYFTIVEKVLERLHLPPVSRDGHSLISELLQSGGQPLVSHR